MALNLLSLHRPVGSSTIQKEVFDMLRLLFVFIGNIILLPINIILLIPRLAFKILLNNRAGLWITAGGKKRIIEVDGNVRIR